MNALLSALAGLPTPDGSRSTTMRGTVAAVNYAARRIEVDLGGETLEVPHLGYIDYYTVGATVLLLADATGPIALGVLGAALTVSPDVTPGLASPPADLSLARSGSRVTASWAEVVGATQYRLRTSLNGGTSWAPTVFTTSREYALGVGQGKTLTVEVAALVAGEWTLWSASAAVTYPLPPVTSQQFTVTIQPSDSGTYRVSRAAWDRWNTDRFDGARAVYQGNDTTYGGGDLRGWAGYGNRIKDLGALELTKVVLKVRRSTWGNSAAAAALQVQGTAAGSRPGGAPSGTGATATTPAALVGKWVSVELPSSMREALRTGSIKGLAAIGAHVAGWYGTGGSMSLEITGRKAT